MWKSSVLTFVKIGMSKNWANYKFFKNLIRDQFSQTYVEIAAEQFSQKLCENHPTLVETYAKGNQTGIPLVTGIVE
jgi:hypothetical protein